MALSALAPHLFSSFRSCLWSKLLSLNHAILKQLVTVRLLNPQLLVTIRSDKNSQTIRNQRSNYLMEEWLSLSHLSLLTFLVLGYQSIVGSLQHLHFIRTDVAFAVSKLSWFTSAPTTIHLVMVKRFLHYLVKESHQIWMPFLAHTRQVIMKITPLLQHRLCV